MGEKTGAIGVRAYRQAGFIVPQRPVDKKLRLDVTRK